MLETKTWFEDNIQLSLRFEEDNGQFVPKVYKAGHIVFHVDRCDPETGEVKENDVHVISFTGLDMEPQLGNLS